MVGPSSHWEIEEACVSVSPGISKPALVSFLKQLHSDLLEMGFSDLIPEQVGLGGLVWDSSSLSLTMTSQWSCLQSFLLWRQGFPHMPRTGWSLWDRY